MPGRFVCIRCARTWCRYARPSFPLPPRRVQWVQRVYVRREWLRSAGEMSVRLTSDGVTEEWLSALPEVPGEWAKEGAASVVLDVAQRLLEGTGVDAAPVVIIRQHVLEQQWKMALSTFERALEDVRVPMKGYAAEMVKQYSEVLESPARRVAAGWVGARCVVWLCVGGVGCVVCVGRARSEGWCGLCFPGGVKYIASRCLDVSERAKLVKRVIKQANDASMKLRMDVIDRKKWEEETTKKHDAEIKDQNAVIANLKRQLKMAGVTVEEDAVTEAFQTPAKRAKVVDQARCMLGGVYVGLLEGWVGVGGGGGGARWVGAWSAARV